MTRRTTKTRQWRAVTTDVAYIFGRRASRRNSVSDGHPSRLRQVGWASSSDVAELTLVHPGDVLFLYTDGVYDGTDKEGRQLLQDVMRKCFRRPAQEICNALMEFSMKQDEYYRRIGEQDRVDDKTVFIIKRS